MQTSLSFPPHLMRPLGRIKAKPCPRFQPLPCPRFQPAGREGASSPDETPPSGQPPAWEQQQPHPIVTSQYRSPGHQQHASDWTAARIAHPSQPQHHNSPQPLHGATPPLKYAQMGHSMFARGSPHICYMHTGTQGIFYDRHQQQQQQQQHNQPQGQQPQRRPAPPGGLGSLMQRAGHVAKALVSNTGSSSSGVDDGSKLRLPWNLSPLQLLLSVVAVAAAGFLLMQFLRGVAAVLVVCYSGFPASP